LLHDCARPHDTVTAACWQAPFPSQKPVLPQGGLAAQLGGSATLRPTFAHTPRLPATLHDWQAGQLGDPQQYPSTQLALAHSLPALHEMPLPFFETHIPGEPLQ